MVREERKSKNEIATFRRLRVQNPAIPNREKPQKPTHSQSLSRCSRPTIKPPDWQIEDHAKARRRQHPIHSSMRYISRNFSSGCTGKSVSQGNHRALVGEHIDAQVLQS
jgi:hypothetical protein